MIKNAGIDDIFGLVFCFKVIPITNEDDLRVLTAMVVDIFLFKLTSRNKDRQTVRANAYSMHAPRLMGR